ncbi:hypothetical protein EVA_18770 [gut metagenome]|uniref:Uncharacterized protein n=1 Tax=gut metagenome TaxID=749906 RepID=J9FFC1_9ZZZZ
MRFLPKISICFFNHLPISAFVQSNSHENFVVFQCDNLLSHLLNL